MNWFAEVLDDLIAQNDRLGPDAVAELRARLGAAVVLGALVANRSSRERTRLFGLRFFFNSDPS